MTELKLFWVLDADARTPRSATTLEWAIGFEGAQKRFKDDARVPTQAGDGWAQVAQDHLSTSRVSTVFLGVDMSVLPDSRPLLFETVVFGGALDGEMARYSTWDEAESGHKTIVERVRAGKQKQ
jgi:hypothetical protein